MSIEHFFDKPRIVKAAPVIPPPMQAPPLDVHPEAAQRPEHPARVAVRAALAKHGPCTLGTLQVHVQLSLVQLRYHIKQVGKRVGQRAGADIWSL